MTKIHPKDLTLKKSDESLYVKNKVLTVWKKSLLFNCEGFTVYNSNGDLVFRVDNYMNGPTDDIVLMDASGLPLLSIRRKKLSLGDCWMVYEGETEKTPIFTARKKVKMIRNKKSLAYVSNKKMMLYEIEGSYNERNCRILDERKSKKKIGEIKRKNEVIGGIDFGKEVFQLIVDEEEMVTKVAMALTIILDQMFH